MLGEASVVRNLPCREGVHDPGARLTGQTAKRVLVPRGLGDLQNHLVSLHLRRQVVVVPDERRLCILDQAFFNILEKLDCPPKNRGFFKTITQRTRSDS